MPSLRIAFFILWASIISMQTPASGQQNNSLPVAGPVDTESAARGAPQALQSVMRVICAQQDSQGTGFLHKSGKIITADHVVKGCAKPLLLLSNNTQVLSSVTASDPDFDFAILTPDTPIVASSLNLAVTPQINIGAQVSTWGFPSGYSGLRPMLSAGILSGQDGVQTASGKIIAQFVVNAAFNSGNSGGPLIHIESGEVIGVVVSKLAQISPSTMSALKALQTTSSGFTYNVTAPNGTTSQLVEGQVIAMVLDDLRKQVQLVIGRAGMIGDLRAFLTANNITP